MILAPGIFAGYQVNYTNEDHNEYLSGSGNYYQGEWKNDLKNGKGILICPDGKYVGEWKDDKK